MACATSGTKTVTHSLAPHLTAAALTTILARLKNPATAQLDQIDDADAKGSMGENGRMLI